MDLEQLEQKAKESILLIKELQGLEKWRIQYLGRKSPLSLFFNSLSKLSLEERKRQGEKANKIRSFLTNLYTNKKTELEKGFFPSVKGSSSLLDITQPGHKKAQGHLHPLTLVSREMIASFEKMGFSIIEGPEIETEYYNFDALNIPADHPAREMWDTLWIKQKTKIQKSKTLLRTHTSPMQVRYMEKNQPPFRIIVPGRCFRYEATDASHEIQFYQIEGLMVGEDVNLSNFKAIISEIIKDIFKQKVSVRFRPSFFPFVSPGVEVDIKQEMQGGQSTDKWLEIMGAGMVHPDLFKRVGYENNRWQGFAFGLGIERVAMIKYKINDIRLFFNPDIRFLEQF
jgi:phenylalanyl-tRNA synthetase alpha chain